MNDFIFHNPDKVYFGRNQLGHLTPRWLKYILNEGTASAIYRLGSKVFGVAEGMETMELNPDDVEKPGRLQRELFPL
jgi:Uncharacterized oxidoreductases, Fe-dependent alcohol dehydrogenase family